MVLGAALTLMPPAMIQTNNAITNARHFTDLFKTLFFISGSPFSLKLYILTISTRFSAFSADLAQHGPVSVIDIKKSF